MFRAGLQGKESGMWASRTLEQEVTNLLTTYNTPGTLHRSSHDHPIEEDPEAHTAYDQPSNTPTDPFKELEESTRQDTMNRLLSYVAFFFFLVPLCFSIIVDHVNIGQGLMVPYLL